MVKPNHEARSLFRSMSIAADADPTRSCSQGAPQPRTIYLVRQLQMATYAGLVEQFGDLDITPTQYMLLSLASRRGGLSSADLARRFRVTPQSMNETIAAAERKGLITRAEDPENRKILRLSLSVAGARLLKRCDRRADRFEQKLFASLTPAEYATLRALLSKTLSKFTHSTAAADRRGTQ